MREKRDLGEGEKMSNEREDTNKGRETRKIVLHEGSEGEQESKEREKVSSEGEQERKKCSFFEEPRVFLLRP